VNAGTIIFDSNMSTVKDTVIFGFYFFFYFRSKPGMLLYQQVILKLNNRIRSKAGIFF